MDGRGNSKRDIVRAVVPFGGFATLDRTDGPRDARSLGLLTVRFDGDKKGRSFPLVHINCFLAKAAAALALPPPPPPPPPGQAAKILSGKKKKKKKMKRISTDSLGT